MQVQAIRCLVIDAFSILSFPVVQEQTANVADYTAVRLLVLLQIECKLKD